MQLTFIAVTATAYIDLITRYCSSRAPTKRQHVAVAAVSVAVAAAFI